MTDNETKLLEILESTLVKTIQEQGQAIEFLQIQVLALRGALVKANLISEADLNEAIGQFRAINARVMEIRNQIDTVQLPPPS